MLIPPREGFAVKHRRPSFWLSEPHVAERISADRLMLHRAGVGASNACPLVPIASDWWSVGLRTWPLPVRMRASGISGP